MVQKSVTSMTCWEHGGGAGNTDSNRVVGDALFDKSKWTADKKTGLVVVTASGFEVCLQKK